MENESQYKRVMEGLRNKRQSLVSTYKSSMKEINLALAAGLVAGALHYGYYLTRDSEPQPTMVEIATRDGRVPTESELQLLTRLDSEHEVMDKITDGVVIASAGIYPLIVAGMYLTSRKAVKERHAGKMEAATLEAYKKTI